MRICITIDDVIRAKTKQFGKIFKRFKNPDINLDEMDVNTDNLMKLFGFEDRRDYHKFIYEDYAFEIFGEASVVDKMLDKKFNLWHLSLDDEEDLDEKIEIIFANPMEFNASIGYTCFFLSKIAPRVREYHFPSDSMTIWDKCDVLITANTHLLENKPECKKSVKIDMPYNKDIESDFSYSSFMELLEDNTFIKKLMEK